MSKLVCTNECCPTKTEGQEPVFNINLSVDADGGVVETISRIDGEFFECCYCHEEAEWKE